MQLSLLKHYTPQQQTDINLVRLFLQVITLSDMSTTDGSDICGHHLRGDRRPNQKIRRKTWPRQETPTAGQKRIWRKYISSQYLRYSTKWRDQLNKITAINRTPYQSYIPLAPGSASTINEYVQDLPTWYRRLLLDFEQIANDVEVWNAFCAKKRLIIASDGSLADKAGTFGWKLTTSKHVPLFEGSGPVDGPIEIGSSPRGELGGFTAPLLLVTVLARIWDLRHKCTFRWIADSQVAINQVTLVTHHDHTPAKQTDNCDYLSLIRDLLKELRRSISAEWIKCHQDDQTTYAKLTPDARLNIGADQLATDQHKKPRSLPMRNTEHLPATKISIQILATRYYGNIDDSIRYHINAGYMKAYLKERNN
jgi:ribonuclease HI